MQDSIRRAPSAILFDRDGTLVVDVPYSGDPERVEAMPGAVEAVAAARAAGLPVGVVSNQSGIARGIVTAAQVAAVNDRVDVLFGGFATWQVCPHGPDDGCECRKPAPGLVLRAARALGVDPADVLVVGDRGSDVAAALAAGAQGVLVPTAATPPEEVAAAQVVADDLPDAVRRALTGRRRGWEEHVPTRVGAAMVEPGFEDGRTMRTTGTAPETADVARRHVAALAPALDALAAESPRLAAWGALLADRLLAGGRLLAAGNGGSAAEAQHLTAELVGRFDGDRRAFSAVCLHGDTSALTAIGNDYGFDEVFARQVTAHARPGDVLALLSTSGASANLVRAAEAGRAAGATVWALTGAAPNPLTAAADDALTLPGPGASVQEAQLVAVHALCRVFDAVVRERIGASR